MFAGCVCDLLFIVFVGYFVWVSCLLFIVGGGLGSFGLCSLVLMVFACLLLLFVDCVVCLRCLFMVYWLCGWIIGLLVMFVNSVVWMLCCILHVWFLFGLFIDLVLLFVVVSL